MLRFALLLILTAPPLQAACSVRDFLTLPLAEGDPAAVALELAYPESRLDGETYTTPSGVEVPYAAARNVAPQDRLDDATMGDMFVYGYPLSFDLGARLLPYNDPGRIRNDALFRALYAETESGARATLAPVSYAGNSVQVDFSVTTLNCVAAQLSAALAVLAETSPTYDTFFEDSGGSFNWRAIAGTNRLSSHSFGAAIDLNTELGGYWRWADRPEGNVGPYQNNMPEGLVATFERYGFIWGGKWHHFDGMHFEYRPELILYARLTAK